MFSKLASLPVFVVLIDLWYGLLLNVVQSAKEPVRNAPNILPTVPDVAFNWLQVSVNFTMVATVTWALWSLLRLHQNLALKQAPSLSLLQMGSLVLVLSFSLPAFYGLMMSVWQMVQGQWVISLANWRYLIVSICMGWCALWCLLALPLWWRLHQHERKKVN